MTLLKQDLYVGDDPAQHGLVWASGDPRTSDGELDPNLLTEHFRADRNSNGNWVLRNENTDTTIVSIHRETNELTLNTPLKINRKIVNDLHLDGTSTRISGFEDGEHLIRHSSTDSDKIMVITRHGESDYDLALYQDGSRSRVHTVADDDIDADFLGGTQADAFGDLSADETITGEWTVENDLWLDRALYSADAVVDAMGSSLFVGTGTSRSFEFETYTGNLLVDGEVRINDGEDTVLTQDTGYIDLEDNGTVVSTSVQTIDFGDSLDVVENDKTHATVSWAGTDVPSEVYQDGSLVVSDANGLDFIDDFLISENADGRAEVVLDSDDYAPIDQQINITGEWTIDIDQGGQLELPMDYVDPTVSATQYPFGLSTMGIGRDTAYPGQNIGALTVRHAANRTFQLGGGMEDRFWFRRYHEDTGWGEFNEIWTDQSDGEGSGLDADLLDGRDSDVYAEVDREETVTKRWTHDTTLELHRGDEYSLKFDRAGEGNEMVYGGWNKADEWSLMPHSGGTWDPNKLTYDFDRDLWEFDQRPKVNGTDVILRDDPILDTSDDNYSKLSISLETASVSLDIAKVVATDTERTVLVKHKEPDYDEWSDDDIWFQPGQGIYVNVDGEAEICASV